LVRIATARGRSVLGFKGSSFKLRFLRLNKVT
jgi:hypothetical protein